MLHSARLAIAVAALIVPAARPVQADTWRPFRALKLIVSDQVDPEGRIWSTRGHFLAAPGGSETVYLITPKDYTVRRLAPSVIPPTGDPTVDVDQASELAMVGMLDRDGAALKWTDGDVRYSLAAKPPLIGVTTLEELRAHTKKYEDAIAAYHPDLNAVQEIRELDGSVEFVIGFGTWCSVCSEWLPHLIKTLEAAGNPEISATWISMSEGLDQPADLIETYRLEETPTFIVRRDGKELGRIVGEELDGHPEMVLENALLGFLHR